jgi:L-arabinose isomerase
MTRKNRIAVLSSYMPFFDEIMPGGYRDERDRFALQAIAPVGDAFDITYLGLIDGNEAGMAMSRRIADLAPDAILVVPTMASPPGYVWNALRDHTAIPIVLWNAHELTTIGPDYDMPELCRHSVNVGTLMIANALHRHAVRPDVLTGPLHDRQVHAELRRRLHAAAVAGRLRRARFGRLGAPIDGYINVDLDAADLKHRIGAEIVDIGLAEWTDALAAVTDAEARALACDLLRAPNESDLSADDGEMLRASRLTVALAALCDRHSLDGGTLNCRGPFAVRHPSVGVLGCLALSYLTGKGRPFTCTGDIATTVAMFLGKALSGSSLYCELDAIDYDLDAFLCANTGEADFGFCDVGQSCHLQRAGRLSGRDAEGVCIRQRFDSGPATMLGFSPNASCASGYVLVAAEGDILGTPPTALGVASALFRTTLRPMTTAFDRWVLAGATHHGSLSSGHLGRSVQAIGRFLGIDTVTF